MSDSYGVKDHLFVCNLARGGPAEALNVQGPLLLDPFELCLCSFCLAPFRADIKGGDGQVIAVDKLDLRAPAPIRTATWVRITAENPKAAALCFSDAEHNGRIDMKTVDPAGFIPVEGGVVTKGI